MKNPMNEFARDLLNTVQLFLSSILLFLNTSNKIIILFNQLIIYPEKNYI